MARATAATYYGLTQMRWLWLLGIRLSVRLSTAKVHSTPTMASTASTTAGTVDEAGKSGKVGTATATTY